MLIPSCPLNLNSLQAAFIEDLATDHRDGRNVAASIGHWGYGSGKTTALLMGALLGSDKPGHRSLFFIQSRDHEESFVDSLTDWGIRVFWNRVGHEIGFSEGPNGARIRFSRISGELFGPLVMDIDRVRGRIYDYIAIDGRPSLGQQGELFGMLNTYGNSRPKLRFL